MSSFAPLNSQGFNVPISDSYDSEVIQGLQVDSPEFKDFLVYLQYAISTLATYTNAKPSGRLNPTEEITGKSLAPSATTTSFNSSSSIRRSTYWVTVPIFNLQNAVASTYNHNIPIADVQQASFTGVYLYGSVTDPVTFTTISLPYAQGANNISLQYNGTVLTVTPNFDARAYTKGYVTIEYVKY